MSKKKHIVFASLVLMVAILSCNLPTRNASNNPVPLDQLQPENESNVSSNYEIDFSNVRLELTDLPQGFRELTDEELTQYGLDIDALLKSITTPLAKAEPQNLSAFSKTEGTSSTIIFSFIVQPLTLLERGAFDLLARDPQQIVSLFNGATPGFSFSPESLADKIGDADVSINFIYDRAVLPLDGNLTLSRRNQVIQAAIEAHLRGGVPAISSVDVARIIDQKIRAALE